jgi:hypothetical protein
MQYRGDLNPNFNVLTSRPGVNAMFRYNFSRGFSLKAEGLFSLIAGADRYSTNPMNKQRDYSFSGMIQEGNIVLEYNFFNFRSSGTVFRSDWTPTLFAGLGLFSMTNRELKANGMTSPMGPVNFPDHLFVYGVGYKRELSTNWNLNFHFGARMRIQKNNRDLIDGLGFSRDEYKNFYPSGGSGTPVALRTANGKTGDRYFYAGVTLSYVLYRLKCPTPKK